MILLYDSEHVCPAPLGSNLLTNCDMFYLACSVVVCGNVSFPAIIFQANLMAPSVSGGNIILVCAIVRPRIMLPPPYKSSSEYVRLAGYIVISSIRQVSRIPTGDYH